MSEKIVLDSPFRWANTQLNAAEFDAWINLVERLGNNRSRLMRQLIREAVGLGPEALSGEFKEVHEAGRQVAAVGRILNQLARHLNGEGILNADVLRKPLEDAQATIERVGRELNRVIYRSRHRWVGRVR